MRSSPHRAAAAAAGRPASADQPRVHGRPQNNVPDAIGARPGQPGKSRVPGQCGALPDWSTVPLFTLGRRVYFGARCIRAVHRGATAYINPLHLHSYTLHPRYHFLTKVLELVSARRCVRQFLTLRTRQSIAHYRSRILRPRSATTLDEHLAATNSASPSHSPRPVYSHLPNQLQRLGGAPLQASFGKFPGIATPDQHTLPRITLCLNTRPPPTRAFVTSTTQRQHHSPSTRSRS